MQDDTRRIVKKLRSKKNKKSKTPAEYSHLLLMQELHAKERACDLLHDMIRSKGAIDATHLRTTTSSKTHKHDKIQPATTTDASQVVQFIKETTDKMDETLEFVDSLQMPVEALVQEECAPIREDLWLRIATSIKQLSQVMQDATTVNNNNTTTTTATRIIPRREEYTPPQVSRSTLYHQEQDTTTTEKIYSELPLWRQILRQSIMLHCETDDLLYGSNNTD